MQIPVLIRDEQVSSIPIINCDEPLVALSQQSADVVVDTSQKNREHLDYEPDFRLRRSVVARLATAQLHLSQLKAGLRFLVKECYRPPIIQRGYFENHLQKTRVRFPSLSYEQAIAEVSKYVAPPDVAPHTTGAAVDLTLIDSDGHELDMGTAYDEDPADCAEACFTEATHISATAQYNRKVMMTALSSAGFVNYPTEWWHWSYGDQYWSFVKGVSTAMYGALDCL